MLRKIARNIKEEVMASFGFISKKYNSAYKKLFPSATIFLYHRVDDVKIENDPYKLCVSRENFDEHIQYISKNYRVITLSALIEELKSDTLKKNTAVITFDDGYTDNMTNALPILQKYNVPAIVFIIAGLIGKNPWWEKTAKIMNETELASLAQNTLIEIGAHTMTHPHLSKQSLDEQEKELKESKKILEEIIKKPIEHFAYPFGSRSDYNGNSITIAKKYYASACTTFRGLVKEGANPHLLPRINIQNWNVKKFKKSI